MHVAIGIGSNEGDSPGIVRRALGMLERAGLKRLRVSLFYWTTPVDCMPETPPFLNGAVTGAWNGGVNDLLGVCKRIERDLGRPSSHSSKEARTIDLDILLFGDRVMRADRLCVPHPNLVKRLFVLAPLAEIAADWPVPPGERTVGELCKQLRSQLGEQTCAALVRPAGRLDDIRQDSSRKKNG